MKLVWPVVVSIQNQGIEEWNKNYSINTFWTTKDVNYSAVMHIVIVSLVGRTLAMVW